MSATGAPQAESRVDSSVVFRLARRFGVQLQDQPSEERVRDLVGRVRVADVDGLAELAATSKKKALQLVRAYNERVAGVTERRALRTPDARRLSRDILSLFSERASSVFARNRLSVRAPALERGLIDGRLAECLTGAAILGELKRAGKRDALKRALAEVAFEALPAKPVVQSDTLACFASRRRAIRAVHSIMTGFDGVGALSSFLKGTDPGALAGALKALEGFESAGTQDAEAVLSDAEMLINDRLRGGRVDEERARRIVEAELEDAVASLRMNSDEEGALRRAAFDALTIPFEFERTARRRVTERWDARQREERAKRLTETEAALRRSWDAVDEALERAVLLDEILAIASAAESYSLVPPSAGGGGGIAFLGGRSLFLERERLEKPDAAEVQPVDYSLGRAGSVKVEGAKPRNVVMLTGANSGGKTTLLTTVASTHILALLGLPVPCERAEVSPAPIYLFRRRVTRKIGSLEQALGSLIPVFSDRRRKLVLMDEFEALTEPGAAGRILAGIVNAVAAGSSPLLLVTHLARETLPHVKLPIRVDGIEAEGLDREGELVVDRQPKFNHIGSSTPKLIIMKLSKAAKKNNDKALYGDILSSLEAETSVPVQTPLSLPWIPEDEQR